MNTATHHLTDCNYCGAVAGVPCTTASGRTTTKPHAARQQATDAIRTEQPEAPQRFGYVCKSCGGPSPVGIGYAAPGAAAEEASADLDACACGYSVRPVAAAVAATEQAAATEDVTEDDILTLFTIADLKATAKDGTDKTLDGATARTAALTEANRHAATLTGPARRLLHATADGPDHLQAVLHDHGITPATIEESRAITPMTVRESSSGTWYVAPVGRWKVRLDGDDHATAIRDSTHVYRVVRELVMDTRVSRSIRNPGHILDLVDRARRTANAAGDLASA